MLNAQSGSPAGTVSAACALSSRTTRESGANAHTRTAIRTNVFARGIRRITADLLSRSRRRSAVSCPGGGEAVYQNRQVNRGADRFPPLACTAAQPADTRNDVREWAHARMALQLEILALRHQLQVL